MPETFVLATNGSRGDAEPFLHLALALKASGSNVRVMSNEIHRPYFQKAGIDFKSVGKPVDFVQTKEFGKKLLAKSPLRQVDTVVRHIFLANIENTYNDYLEGFQHGDFAIIHYIDFAAQRAAMQQNIPWVSVVLCPGTIPSKIIPPMQIRSHPFLYPFLWKLYKNITFLSDRLINRTLKKLSGLSAPVSISGTPSPYANLITASRHVADIPPDLDSSYFVTGLLKGCEKSSLTTPEYHIHFSDNAEGAFQQDLMQYQKFVHEKKPQVAFTFGSMAGMEASFLASLIKETAELAGVRAVVVGGWIFAGDTSSSGKDSTPFASHPDLFFIREIPYELLFNEVDVVVHHGGAGTTQEVAFAGALSIVIPHIADQFYWGHLVYEKGIGSKPILIRELTAQKLATQILNLLNDTESKKRARSISRKMREEVHCAGTVEFLKDFTKKHKNTL